MVGSPVVSIGYSIGSMLHAGAGALVEVLVSVLEQPVGLDFGENANAAKRSVNVEIIESGGRTEFSSFPRSRERRPTPSAVCG